MLVALLLIPLSSPTPAPTRTQPISPIPLHELVVASDLIAVVRPGASEDLHPSSSFLPSKRVELVIEEVLLGSQAASVTTDYPQWVCPEPPHYPEGERVLVFLGHTDEQGWHAVGLSYGTKRLDAPALQVYRARIDDLSELIAARRERWKSSPKFVEWLVRCAEEPATRWEGAYPLDPTGDFLHDVAEPPRTFGHRLDAGQRARLSKALLAAPSIDTGEACLLQLFAVEPDRALDDFALEHLPALLPDRIHLAPVIMLVLARRSGDSVALSMARDFEQSWYEDSEPGKTPGLVADFVQHVSGLR